MKRPQVFLVPGTQDSQLPWECPVESYGKGSMRTNIIRYTRLRETDPCVDFIVQYFWYDKESGEMRTDTIRDTEIWPERFPPVMSDEEQIEMYGSCLDEKPWIEKALQEEALREMLAQFEANEQYSEDDAAVIRNARKALEKDDRCTAHELNVPCDICDGEE